MLRASELSIGYHLGRGRTHEVGSGLDLHLEEGELVCLIGPNGAGKSTLMRTLAGIQPALAGQVLLDDRDLHSLSPRERARRLGVVLTDGAIPGHLSAHSLVALGRHPHTGWTGALGATDRQVVAEAIEAVGAEDLADRFVADLSDGERQKVLVARALAQEPRLMILDEITAFLDLPRRVEILGLLRALGHRLKRTVLISTHDLDLALHSADRIWLMSADGRLRAGAPEDLVLDGSFEAVFASEGVDFDRTHGSFRIHSPARGEVHLVGEGEVRDWTLRALRRRGLDIWQPGSARPEPALRVEVLGPTENGHAWRLHDGDRITEVRSLHALGRALPPDTSIAESPAGAHR